MTATEQISDTVLLDRREDIVRAGERIELDHGKWIGFSPDLMQGRAINVAGRVIV